MIGHSYSVLKQSLEGLGRTTHHRPETLEFHQSAIGKAVQVMRHDPSASLDWNRLAEIACMSRYHFLRIFESLTAASPHRFLIALRMERAKQMLIETTMDVSDICLAVGYTSIGTFIRVFRKLVGVAPGGFRQLVQKLGQPGLQILLAEHLSRRIHFYPGNALRADLYLPESFTGNILTGLFDPQLQPLTPPAVSVVRQSRTVSIPVGGGIKEARLLAIGFPDDLSTNQYFLPGRLLPMAISPLIQSSPDNPAIIPNLSLKLEPSGAFDLPVLTCLPLILLKATETKYVE